MRLTDNVFHDDGLQTSRLKLRYETLQDWYSQEVTTVKRNQALSFESDHFNLIHHKEESESVALALGIKWGWDIPTLMLKLIANWDFAVDNKNRYLMRESLHGFPIMNYVLKEGPFKVRPEAVFGDEDYHVILRGDEGTLIYFLPDQDGLKTGRYVECLL